MLTRIDSKPNVIHWIYRLIKGQILSLILLLGLSPQASALTGSTQFESMDDEVVQQIVSGSVNARVKLPNGEYIESTLDMRVKVLGGEVKLDRTWVNGRWYLNPAWSNLHFGYDPLDNSVNTIDRTGVIYQRSGDSSLYLFNQVSIRKTDRGWRWQDKAGSWIDYDPSGRMTAYGNKNNVKVEFVLDAFGRRTAIKDHFGEVVYTFVYDGQERLIQAKDRSNRSVSYQWNGDRLTKVTDVLGNDWLYGYDGNGQLTQRTEPDGGMIKIAYTSSELAAKPEMNSGKDLPNLAQGHTTTTGSIAKESKTARVGKVTDKTGAVTIWNTQYDRSSKQYTIEAEDSLGKKTVTRFDAEGRKLSQSVNGTLRETLTREGDYLLKVTDERGLITSVQYDSAHRPIKITHPNGASELFEYSEEFGQITSHTNVSGDIATRYYDAKGNLVRNVQAVGKPEQRVISWDYDTYGQLIKVAVGEGEQAVTLQQAFDRYGNAATVTDGNGNRFQLSYDIQGQVVSIKDPLNQTSTYRYNPAGYRTESINPLNHITKYETDALGRMVKVTDPLGNITRYAHRYDTHGTVTEQTDALNQTVTYHYDLAGRFIQTVSPTGLLQQQTYDSQGRLQQQTDPAGNSVVREYGGKDSGLEGLIASVIYPTYRERYKYNSLGLPTEVSQLLDDNNSLSTRISYNEQGLPVSVTEPGNRTSLTEYDAFGNVISLTDASGGKTQQFWDALGNLLSLVDASGNQYSFTYDKNTNLIKEVSPASGTVEYTYNAVNQQVQRKDASGNIVTYHYDAAGRKVKEIYSRSGQADALQTVNYRYDDAGWLVEIQQTGDTTSRYVYTRDALGRKIKETVTYGDANRTFSRNIQYAYDADGFLTAVTYPDNTTFSYRYEKGQLSLALLPAEQKITWQQYGWLYPEKISYPGTEQTRTYDALQRPLSIKVTANSKVVMDRHYAYDPAGNIAQRQTEQGSYNYKYDLLNQLTLAMPSAELQQSGLLVESYAYDAIGNRIGSGHQPGNWQYNSQAQLSQWGDGAQQTKLTYTANGNTATETAITNALSYVYNAVDRLTAVKSNDVEVAHYQYDPLGRRISKTVAGITIWYLYSDQGLIAELDQQGTIIVAYGWQPDSDWGTQPLWQAKPTAGGSLQTAQYHYLHTDHLGTPQLAINASGQSTWKGLYEAFGQVIPALDNQITMNLRFPGQYFDRETGTHYNYFRDYDPAIGRYVQKDPIGLTGGDNFYSYGNSNPLSYYDPNGEVAFLVPIVIGAVGGYIFDWAVSKYKKSHCECDNVETFLGSKGAIIAGSTLGTFGPSEVKPRKGLGGWGKTKYTSQFSKALSSKLQNTKPGSKKFRFLKNLRYIGRRMPYISYILGAYDLYDAIECK